MCVASTGSVVEVIRRVDHFVPVAYELDDGAFVVFAAVDEPLDHADDDDDEESYDAVVWAFLLVNELQGFGVAWQWAGGKGECGLEENGELEMGGWVEGCLDEESNGWSVMYGTKWTTYSCCSL